MSCRLYPIEVIFSEKRSSHELRTAPMKITVNAKQAGQKRALIEPITIEIENLSTAPSLEELIAAIVRHQVTEFNGRRKNLVEFLTPDKIAYQTETGKVAFGDPLDARSADADKAVETATTAFGDGLFAVFVDDREIRELGEVIELSEHSRITFIRLTFLVGSIW